MKRIFSILFSVAIILIGFSAASGQTRTMKVECRYLNFPVSQKDSRCMMSLSSPGQENYSFNIRISTEDPEYWVFMDVSRYIGKDIVLSCPEYRTGLDSIFQSDDIAGQDSLYREYNRPQIHYTQKRGWNNDPNGLVFHEGEYHLFYQHNPFEKEWENMHWGHAVSRDLVHWEELPLALFPDSLGTMYSGSAVVDYDNTSGFGSDGKAPMVAVYTAASPGRQVQCVAYSIDNGRTWTKYSGNPVIDSGKKWGSADTRDPKVFWHAPSGQWVMVLNERDGHSIYNSPDLKHWMYRSHVTGFWECPDLFPLPVDGNGDDIRWVMYGASGTYMIGDFDGSVFMPQTGKYYYTGGSMYAAQTFSNMPDGRRVQIGWGRISHPGMPFNGTFLLPTELTLRDTRDGVRLFSEPVRELESIQHRIYEGKDLSQDEASAVLNEVGDSRTLRIKAVICLSHATSAGLSLDGQNILDYDMNSNKVNGVFYSPDDMTSMELSFDMYLDRTVAEVFIDGGAYSYSLQISSPKPGEGFSFWGNRVTVKSLEVYLFDSIWRD